MISSLQDLAEPEARQEVVANELEIDGSTHYVWFAADCETLEVPAVEASLQIQPRHIIVLMDVFERGLFSYPNNYDGGGKWRRMADYQPPLTEEEREEIIDIYEDVRVTDVTDGLDFYGFGYELNKMSPEISPLYRDMEAFDHRAVGFAHTVRFLPTNRRRNLPDELGYETGSEWRDEWYSERSGGPTDITDHDVIVLESHNLPCGIIGSANALGWIADGAVGVVTNGGPRDTDEMIKENIPTYSKTINKPIIPGRTEYDDSQIPVNVGGCLVRPEDVIVADGDGVVVVPIEFAKRVGEAARTEQQDDQEARRKYYEKAGLEPDFTLE